MPIPSWAFLVGVASVVAVRLWLLRRQLRHLRIHRGFVPPSFRDQVPREAQIQAADYAGARARVAMAETMVEASLLLVLTLGGGADLVLGLWERTGLSPLLWGAGAVLTVAGLLALADLPFQAYRTFRVEEAFGFNRRGPGLFVLDTLREAVLALLLAGPLIAAFLALMENAATLWWLYAWALWTAFSLALTWAYPKWIAPLFHRFTPLKDSQLQERVAALLRRCGFSLKGVYVMDASRRTAHGNAYFTGLGPAKRVVFFDTLLESLAPEEVEAVLAHELGHYRLAHIRSGFLAGVMVSLAVLLLLAWAREQAWLFYGLGVSAPSEAALLVLALLIGPWLAFPLRPLTAWWSRRREFQADAFAARLSQPEALAKALVTLYRSNASPLTSDPLYARVYHSHPGPTERIAALTP